MAAGVQVSASHAVAVIRRLGSVPSEPTTATRSLHQRVQPAPTPSRHPAVMGSRRASPQRIGGGPVAKRSVALSVFMVAALTAGCAAAAVPSGTVTPAASPIAMASPTVSSPEAPSPSPVDTIPTLPDDQALEAGTYRLARSVVGPRFPPILVTVPDGWLSIRGGWAIKRSRAGEDFDPVAVQFWDVAEIYGHPCQWKGSLFDPGPTVDDLAEALVDVPLRDATQPADVTIDGYDGKYLEWSVPADMKVGEHNGYSDFEGCDVTGDGDRAFFSWTASGQASALYHQAAGQVDRLWIVDVDGARLVIDGTSMPRATSEEIGELHDVVESIRFER